MTYIEFFNDVSIENICACLTNVPDRVIYIGRDKKAIDNKIVRYKKLFDSRGEKNIEFLSRTIKKDSLDSAVSVLQEIVNTYDDCVFGVTGGDEIALMAFGIVYERNRKTKDIKFHRFNISNNTICDCDGDGKTVYDEMPVLSVDENILIYGGDVLYGDVWSDDTYKWRLDKDFINDIGLIWNVCKGNARLWNVQIGVFEAVYKVGIKSEDRLTAVANIAKVKEQLQKNHSSYVSVKGIIKYLLNKGLLTRFDEDEASITIGFKNPQIMRCLTKAGQALEMKIYVTALGIKNKGESTYNDIVNGVLIDWDGNFHDDCRENIYDTENEIDIIMMRGAVPVFVSCKNGGVEAEELYKLNTVATRFGGKYAKKVLIATSIPKNTQAGKYFIQRAQDMNIKLINDVKYLKDNELAEKLGNLWK
ncbi:MAG: DUF1887 family CARF protein [Acutalibacteraceae bacterium]|nr:DUF1887 family CARF protein [Acutalibacteraceae bacterium]